MKKVFSVLAVAALVLVITGCTPQEKTLSDYLTQQTKGWVLSSATSSPAYQMSNGEFVSDLVNGGYLYDWEKEYVIIFNENGSEIVKPGKTVAPSAEQGYIAETSLGNWTITETAAGDILEMQVPFFMDDEKEVCRIISLNDNELKVNCTINDDPVVSKGTYTFTLTFVPAK